MVKLKFIISSITVKTQFSKYALNMLIARFPFMRIQYVFADLMLGDKDNENYKLSWLSTNYKDTLHLFHTTKASLVWSHGLNFIVA